MALVLDTGVLYAALDASDPDHGRCADLLERATEDLLVPAPVLVELDYWVRKFASAEAWLAFMERVVDGAFGVYRLDDGELLAAAKIQARYPEVRLGFVDAAVFVTCESLSESKVATLDRRQFCVLRTDDGRALEILPD
jgi:predicted nucleic acid-binding protein